MDDAVTKANCHASSVVAPSSSCITWVVATASSNCDAATCAGVAHVANHLASILTEVSSNPQAATLIQTLIGPLFRSKKIIVDSRDSFR